MVTPLANTEAQYLRSWIYSYFSLCMFLEVFHSLASLLHVLEVFLMRTYMWTLKLILSPRFAEEAHLASGDITLFKICHEMSKCRRPRIIICNQTRRMFFLKKKARENGKNTYTDIVSRPYFFFLFIIIRHCFNFENEENRQQSFFFLLFGHVLWRHVNEFNKTKLFLLFWILVL